MELLLERCLGLEAADHVGGSFILGSWMSSLGMNSMNEAGDLTRSHSSQRICAKKKKKKEGKEQEKNYVSMLDM